MPIEVIVALITLLGTLIGTFSGIVVSSKLTNYRIEQLEKKVDKHNQVVERVYRLEQQDAVFTKEFSDTQRRLKTLEDTMRRR